MDDRAIGRRYRAVRIRKGLRQEDVGAMAGVSPDAVSRLERGLIGGMTVQRIRAIGDALSMTLDLVPRWNGGELDRLLGARHSALHDEVAAAFAALPGWTVAPEVTFSIYGERGAIDILAWHAPTRTLLVIELKTEIVDVQELIGTLDRKRRLAPQIGRSRGWEALVVASWVIVAGGRTNRRRVAAHASVIRAAFPADGRTMDRWLRAPAGAVNALSWWWPNTDGVRAVRELAARQRVRRRPAAPSATPARTDGRGRPVPGGSGLAELRRDGA